MINKVLKFTIGIYKNFVEGHKNRISKNKEAFKEAFKASVFPQSESDFISLCFQNCNDDQQKVALSTRKVIAILGDVEIEYIRADISFEQLDGLEFWRSCGDVGFNTQLFVEELLKELGIEFSDKVDRTLISVRDPDMNTNIKIYEFVNDLYKWYATFTTNFE